jgi:DNA-binding protein H-NS
MASGLGPKPSPPTSRTDCIGTFRMRCPALIGHLDPLLWTLVMKADDLKSMSIDELWALHLEITSVLASRISAEKTQLEERLKQLQSSGTSNGKFRRDRRAYPQVLPKYRNPAEPSETWAGRGKQPRWLTTQLRSGKKLDDFRIQPSSVRARRPARR